MSDLGSLERAIRTGRAVNMPVDLQYQFYHATWENKKRAFRVAGELTDAFHATRRVPTIFIAYTGRWKLSTLAEFNARHGFSQRCLHESIKTQPTDLVFEKGDIDAFSGNPDTFAPALRSKGYNVLVVSGVDYNTCVKATILGALKNNFIVYAVADATNCPPEKVEGWTENFVGRHAKYEWAPNYHLTDTASVLSLLKPAEYKAAG